MTRHGQSSSYKWELALLWVLNLIDGLVTYWFLGNSPLSTGDGAFVVVEEQNPLMQWAFDQGVFLHLKIWGVTLLCCVMYLIYNKHPTSPRTPLRFGIFVYLAVCLWHAYNYYMIFL